MVQLAALGGARAGARRAAVASEDETCHAIVMGEPPHAVRAPGQAAPTQHEACHAERAMPQHVAHINA